MMWHIFATKAGSLHLNIILKS